VLTVGSLFSGIGGFDLGLERAGMRTLWFCEQDSYCQRVLAKHWPGVPCHPDVRGLVADAGSSGRRKDVRGTYGDEGQNGRRTAAHANKLDRSREGTGAREILSVPVPYVDILCGGFPCQDLSYAGKGAGIDGARSGLWSEYARLIRELRPRYVIVENVPALLARGLGRVLGDLAACGYDAEWDCIPASAVGAPHRRDRIWLVAYPAWDGARQQAPAGAIGERVGASREPSATGDMAYPNHGRFVLRAGERAISSGDPDGTGLNRHADYWLVEPELGRVAHGVPNRVDRLRALGNALVPQIAELIGRRIIEWET
jgi:DNA (cytosine-5)-methyltransferase 1